jgi:hypothetical protein
MDRRKLFLVILAAAIPLLLMAVVVIAGAAWYLRGREKPVPTAVVQMTLCDVNASGICLVSFGADQMNQMVINLHMPRGNYPEMYAVVTSRGSANRFTCQTVEDSPKSVYCTGTRTPLGEPVSLKLIATENEVLIAEGTFVVMAIALPSPMNFTLAPGDLTEEPIETVTPFTRPLPGFTRTVPTTPVTTGTITPTQGTPSPGTPSMSPTVTFTGTPATSTPTATRTP